MSTFIADLSNGLSRQSVADFVSKIVYDYSSTDGVADARGDIDLFVSHIFDTTQVPALGSVIYDDCLTYVIEGNLGRDAASDDRATRCSAILVGLSVLRAQIEDDVGQLGDVLWMFSIIIEATMKVDLSGHAIRSLGLWLDELLMGKDRWQPVRGPVVDLASLAACTRDISLSTARLQDAEPAIALWDVPYLAKGEVSRKFQRLRRQLVHDILRDI